jgi:DNA-binding response OmpR family regulator
MAHKKLLIIDDDKTFLDELAKALSAHRFEVVTVADPAAALEKAIETAPHVVLLDLKMSDMNGYQVARELKLCTATASIPIIAMTGVFGKEQHMALLRACGITMCLEKPVNMAELVAQVKHCVRSGFNGG